MKILIAEDDLVIRILITRSLTQEGHNICQVNDGEEAINQLKTFEPDLILTDIMMPNLNGIELLEYVKSNEEMRNIPILAMTAAKKIPESPFEFNHILHKPFELSNLKKKINEFNLKNLTQ